MLQGAVIEEKHTKEKESRYNPFKLSNDETYVLNGHVRGLVLSDVVPVEFMGQRGVVHGCMLQGSDTLLECMIVRAFDLVRLSLRLLVRERVLPETGDTRFDVGMTRTSEVHSRSVRAVMQRIWVSVDEVSRHPTKSETFLVRLTAVGSCYWSKLQQDWRSVKRQ